MKNSKNIPAVIRLPEQLKNTEKLAVYVVAEDGTVVESVGFKGREANLKSTRGTLEGGSRIYIAQTSNPSDQITERSLLKASAYQVVQQFSEHAIDIARLPDSVLRPWNWYNCLIKGHVSKNFIVDGNSQDLPVCHARVHICEVETEFILPHIPIYYRRIPDWVIQEVVQKIIGLAGPGPVENAGRVARPAENFAPTVERMAMPQSSSTFSSLNISNKSSALPEIPPHVLAKLSSGSAEIARQAIYDHHALLYPYFCLWPIYWPWFYSCDEETIVYTDCNGRFEMWENTFTEDGPLNIYVWVEAWINGQWVTVYRPPLPCHTWWNYPCGSEISINVTDTRVVPCDCDLGATGEVVWFRSIGESATALHIEQADANTVVLQGANLRNVGCTDVIAGNGVRVSPFGADLSFKLLFGDALPSAGITHYRWKRTRIKDANLNSVIDTPQVLAGEIRKSYFYITTVGGHTHIETRSVPLGADGAGQNIGYKIPHWDIYQEPLVPAADRAGTIAWTSPDFWSASIDSTSLTDGLYRFDLELLNLVAGVFQVVKVAKPVFQVSDANNAGNSVDAPDAYLNINPADHSQAFNLSVKVRIDNAVCTADIQDAELTDGHGSLVLDGGQPIRSGTCGFIHYTDTNQGTWISFVASHPRNFATFGFSVIKGNNTVSTGVAASGYVISSVAPFTLSGGVFADDVSVAQLIGLCPQAAFSENLNVYALATNGTTRLYNCDASDVNAFALSNT